MQARKGWLTLATLVRQTLCRCATVPKGGNPKGFRCWWSLTAGCLPIGAEKVLGSTTGEGAAEISAPTPGTIPFLSARIGNGLRGNVRGFFPPGKAGLETGHQGLTAQRDPVDLQPRRSLRSEINVVSQPKSPAHAPTLCPSDSLQLPRRSTDSSRL